MEEHLSKIDIKFWQGYGLPNLQQIGSLEEYVRKLMDRMSSLPEARTVTNRSPNTYPDAPVAPVRDRIFISYSHDDAFWHQELKNMLSPVLGEHKIWDDTMILPGAVWKEEIEKALTSTKVAVLLVSPAFLKSPFIMNNELPQLLEAARTGGCRILWIKVKESLVDFTPIGQYQALYNKPLIRLDTDADRNEALKEIANGILKQPVAG
jgi:hypothetical protein